MKRLTVIILIVLIAVSLGFANTSSKIHSYRDIPGITKDEITAIEALKNSHSGFSYGHMHSTESFLQPDGTYDGFTIKLCVLLSDLFGTEFTPRIFDGQKQLKDSLDNLETDFTGEFSPTSVLMKDYIMTDPIAGRSLNVYTLTDSDIIKTESDVNGLNVGFLSDSITAALIMEHYPDLSFNILNALDFPEAAAMLKSGEIDAFVTDEVLDIFFDDYSFVKSRSLFPLAFTYTSVTTANYELSPIISVINKYLLAGGTDILFGLYDEGVTEYKKHKLFQSFTDDERAWLDNYYASGKKVNIGLQHDAYPVSFYNKTEKEFQGVALDILSEITKLTGVEFDAITTSTDTPISDILIKLKSGELSMMTQLLYTESRKNDYIWSGVPYLSTKYGLISSIDYPDLKPYQVYYKKVGTVYKTAHEVMFELWFPGHEKQIKYLTVDAAFDALENGEVDLVMLSGSMLLAQTNYREKSGYKMNIIFDTTLDSLLGFNKDEVILRSIVDKSMGYINIENIGDVWMGRVFDYTRKISVMQTIYLSVFAVVSLLVLAVLSFVLLKNKRLGKSLLEQTAQLSTIYTSIPDIVFSMDKNLVYTSCNPSFEKLAGLPAEQIIGKTDYDIFNTETEMVKNFIQLNKKVLINRKTEFTQEWVKYPDGTERLLETIKTPLLRDGVLTGLMGIARDITERREAKEQLSSVINAAQIAFMLSINGIIIETNEYSRMHIGLNTGDDVSHFRTESDRFKEVLEKAEQEGMASNELLQIDLPNGEVHRFLSSITFTKYRGETACLIWALDVEESEQKNDLLRSTQNSLRTILDTLPMPIRIVDIESTEIVYANDSLVELLEYDSYLDIRGNNISMLLPATLSNGTISATQIKSILNAEAPKSIETEYLTKSGRIIEAIVVTRQIEYKGRLSSLGIIKDLTAEKERSRILLNAAEREKEANQAKSRFLANMSHEIRTPMNGIIGMTDLLMSEKLPPRHLQYVSDIKTSAESLLGIINDILDLSKINEGNLKIIPVDIDMNLMLKNIVSMMRFSANTKGLTFIEEININSPEFVRVDDVRLNQIVINLLSNAIKFTKEGHVRFTAKIEDGSIIIEVSDTGIGIKQDDMLQIFKAFEQADTYKNRTIKGTGLGLSISKNLAELMGGNIWVESEYGKGTSFFVVLPYVPGDESAARVINNEFKYISAPTAQVLLVDDIQTNLTVGAGLLRLCGITADVAMSGLEAIELIKKKAYDIVFMDHMMPEMDGIETMKAIRELGDFSDLPIIALTANAVNESKDLLLSSGMDDFLSKPIDKVAFIQMLQKWLPADKVSEGEAVSETERYSEVLTAAAAIDGLDIELALGRISGLQAVLETSIKQVSSGIPEHLKKMEVFLSDGDLRGFSIEAHGLKGSLASIGATRNSELAAELEIASKAGNMPLCVDKFTVFGDTMLAFADELQAIFKTEQTLDKPQGENDFLKLKVGEAIDCLNNFEAADALERLNELANFSYGAELDAVLNEAISTVEAYAYKKAVLMLKELI